MFFVYDRNVLLANRYLILLEIIGSQIFFKPMSSDAIFSSISFENRKDPTLDSLISLITHSSLI
jgi:hypothetical protein